MCIFLSAIRLNIAYPVELFTQFTKVTLLLLLLLHPSLPASSSLMAGVFSANKSVRNVRLPGAIWKGIFKTQITLKGFRYPVSESGNTCSGKLPSHFTHELLLPFARQSTK